MALASSKSTTAAPTNATKPAPANKPAPTKTAAKRALDPQVRLRMIAEAAYYIAEKRGFIHGHHDVDWAAAEQQIDALLSV